MPSAMSSRFCSESSCHHGQHRALMKPRHSGQRHRDDDGGARARRCDARGAAGATADTTARRRPDERAARPNQPICTDTDITWRHMSSRPPPPPARTRATGGRGGGGHAACESVDDDARQREGRERESRERDERGRAGRVEAGLVGRQKASRMIGRQKASRLVGRQNAPRLIGRQTRRVSSDDKTRRARIERETRPIGGASASARPTAARGGSASCGTASFQGAVTPAALTP